MTVKSCRVERETGGWGREAHMPSKVFFSLFGRFGVPSGAEELVEIMVF